MSETEIEIPIEPLCVENFQPEGVPNLKQEQLKLLVNEESLVQRTERRIQKIQKLRTALSKIEDSLDERKKVKLKRILQLKTKLEESRAKREHKRVEIGQFEAQISENTEERRRKEEEALTEFVQSKKHLKLDLEQLEKQIELLTDFKASKVKCWYFGIYKYMIDVYLKLYYLHDIYYRGSFERYIVGNERPIYRITPKANV